MGKKQYELTESEWLRIKDMLPSEHPKEGKCGRPAKCDNYSAMNELKSEIVSAQMLSQSLQTAKFQNPFIGTRLWSD